MLCVHLVFAEVIDPHGLERARSDVQGHVRAHDAGALAGGEQRCVEVQSGGRGGYGSGRARIDRLVALAIRVLDRTMQVRRQRHLTVTVEERGRRSPEIEHPEIAVAAGDPGPVALGQVDARPDRRRLARAQLHEGAVPADHTLEQDLDAAPGLLAAVQPRRDHARVVDDQQVPRTQQAWELDESAVGQRPGAPVQVQQPAVAAPRDRVPRDQVVGKFVVEVAAAHGPRMLAEPP